MTATAAAPAARRNWRALAALLAVGIAPMALLKVWHPGSSSADLVALANQPPAKLSAFLDASGHDVAIESFHGKTVVLNLWAPWCAPCLREMPSLDRLAARLSEQDFAVVAVTKDPVGDSPSKRTFDRMGLKRLKLYLDPAGKLPPELGARGFPTTVILGPDGAPLAYREGEAEWDADAMAAKLDALAGRTKRAE
jgi:thiol-disulfide isomerase/thioredoxin